MNNKCRAMSGGNTEYATKRHKNISVISPFITVIVAASRGGVRPE
jgi:hypothetical protein